MLVRLQGEERDSVMMPGAVLVEWYFFAVIRPPFSWWIEDC